MKLLYTLALIGASFMSTAQSLTVINTTTCNLVCSASGKCTTCGCLTMQTNQYGVNAGTTVTFSSMVTVNSGVGWSRGGPATGVGVWELVKVGTPSCSKLVGQGSCYTLLSGALPCCSATAVWINDGLGNITVTVN